MPDETNQAAFGASAYYTPERREANRRRNAAMAEVLRRLAGEPTEADKPSPEVPLPLPKPMP